jgi:1-acyl-sn-glycerol-3-phosphate acyltransferase
MLRTAFALLVFVILSLLLIAALALIAVLRLPWRGTVSMAYSRTLCTLIGLRITCIGAPAQGGAVLIVSNHVSWVDILAITATVPAIFVAKSEVASWPLIGWIARVRGTVFVDRAKRQHTKDVNAAIAARLAEGAAIVLFGEGTSSDGNRVLPFRSALLGAANDALTGRGLGAITLQPLSIAYTQLQGLPMGRQHRGIAAWTGDLGLVPHLIDFITYSPADVTLSWGAPLAFDAAADRKQLAKSMEQAVRSLTIEALRGPRPVRRVA